MSAIETRVMTAHVPRPLAEQVDQLASKLERSRGWVLKQALPKLRVQVDWFSPVERVHREALGLRWLERIAPPGTITPLVFEDVPQHCIAMAAVPQPHENWKQMLLRGEVVPDHVDQFATLLATIHRESALRRTELEPVLFVPLKSGVS